MTISWTAQILLFVNNQQEQHTWAICQHGPLEVSNECIAVRKAATPLQELTCHMGSATEVTFPQHRLCPSMAGTRFSDPAGARLSWDGWLHTEWYARPKTVTRPSTNRARRGLTWFVRWTPLTACSCEFAPSLRVVVHRVSLHITTER